ncbi:short-chain dehydrogenase [Hyphomicrobium nitrativorans NL23]|uniref:Short-chain dehydrogenase n=1 Tax=Hyphomicrobium nitrativorans NL23 TaxID=1029756 RepID=V5SAN8_9HYPH|nr:SDR family oxidoreductase [Hyphomicrobium nitrativorans]AHB47796.1 short-chain dehydrogenase [Hyphomicrobium nitrativorans NL23]
MTRPKTLERAKQASEESRKIQSHINELDKKEGTSRGGRKKHGAVQAGQRRYPDELDETQLDKPGHEKDLATAPMYEAPAYKGSEKLAGMAALITGGDSGIGRAVAVLYAREGADIAISYLDEHDDARETKEAVEKEGVRCILLPGDVTDRATCEDAVTKTLDAFGAIDIVVANAAFQEHAFEISDISDDHFDRTMKTNLYGLFYLTRAAIPHMRPGSSIIMTGSITGIDGSKDLLDYSLTKGGIHAFARALSAHVLPRGIRVNAIAPGPVWTPLNPADRPADEVREFGQSTPMKRAAQPEEIAPAYVFLAAPSCSSYITGEILPIVGGYD